MSAEVPSAPAARHWAEAVAEGVANNGDADLLVPGSAELADHADLLAAEDEVRQAERLFKAASHIFAAGDDSNALRTLLRSAFGEHPAMRARRVLDTGSGKKGRTLLMEAAMHDCVKSIEVLAREFRCPMNTTSAVTGELFDIYILSTRRQPHRNRYSSYPHNEQACRHRIARFSLASTVYAVHAPTGYTALHCAAYHGKQAAASALLLHGADPTVTNSSGESAAAAAANGRCPTAILPLLHAFAVGPVIAAAEDSDAGLQLPADTLTANAVYAAVQKRRCRTVSSSSTTTNSVNSVHSSVLGAAGGQGEAAWRSMMLRRLAKGDGGLGADPFERTAMAPYIAQALASGRDPFITEVGHSVCLFTYSESSRCRTF
jgi:Ankyrin repeat